MQVMRQTIGSYGVPKSLYLDGWSAFFSTKPPAIEGQMVGKARRVTQFGAMMDELGVVMIHARSSQAKGRIERVWGTLQGRLETEFALYGIESVEQANEFFVLFLRRFNDRFGVLAVSEVCKFMAVPDHVDLDRFFAVKVVRRVDRGGCFSFGGVLFQCGIVGVGPVQRLWCWLVGCWVLGCFLRIGCMWLCLFWIRSGGRFWVCLLGCGGGFCWVVVF